MYSYGQLYTFFFEAIMITLLSTFRRFTRKGYVKCLTNAGRAVMLCHMKFLGIDLTIHKALSLGKRVLELERQGEQLQHDLKDLAKLIETTRRKVYREFPGSAGDKEDQPAPPALPPGMPDGPVRRTGEPFVLTDLFS